MKIATIIRGKLFEKNAVIEKQIKITPLLYKQQYHEKRIDFIKSYKFSTLNQKSHNVISKMYQKFSKY
jgi:hypothetical protein